MSLSELGIKIGQVESISIDAPYVIDPLQAYRQFSNQNTLLLESAEIDSKDNLQSLLLIDAALRIECNDNVVTVTALSNNGKGVIPVLTDTFASYSTNDVVLVESTEGVTITFNKTQQSVDEDTRLKQHSVFDVLRALTDNIQAIRAHQHAIFLGGVFAYDLLATFEQLPQVKDSENTCPDYVFYLAETLLTIDHQHKTSELLGSVFSGQNVAQHYFDMHQRLEHIKNQLNNIKQNRTLSVDAISKNTQPTVHVDKSDAVYCEDVVALQQHILSGDIFQVVPSRTFSLPCTDPLLAYQALKQQNPSPYMFCMNDQHFTIFGASPESALKYDSSNNVVEIYPIAGTRPRGKNADGSINFDLDSRLELNLREDEKEKAEHIMLVDLARNDVAKVCEPGSRHVKDLLKVDRYSHVMHLVSRVVGQLRSDLDALHAYQACMNMGTLVGAPKVSAASLIRQTEKKRRGSYGGAVGYLNGKGDMDTCIVIRSAFVNNKVAYVQAGAGVVNDSVPQSEADETRTKAQAVINAILSTQSISNQQGEG